MENPSSRVTSAASNLADAAIDWLRENFAQFPFVLERDVVWTLQMHLAKSIGAQSLPLRVFNDYPMFPGPRRGLPTDLAILNARKEVEVALEVKFEPSHNRPDILKTKLPVVSWGDAGVAKDVKRVHEYVAQGKAHLAIALFIDEGSYFRRRDPHPGSKWLDWGRAVSVLYARESKEFES
jgi:hypothetical protein